VRLLDHDVLTIGAAPGNDLVVPFPGISRAHARILRDGAGAFWLEDVGSRYGTKVNGRAVRRVRLAHGDEIAAGSWRASFRLD
jgi:pSer/pThr/pTyr-binding forkhead associated (FHA) protein